MTWTRKGNGYYVATGYSGIAVTVMRVQVRTERGGAPSQWNVYAGDQTFTRASAPTLREAQAAAERLFG